MARSRTRRDDGSLSPPSGTPRLAALRLLGRRDYTSQEIIERLVARGYADDETRAAVAALVHEGAIDDRRTASAHVRHAAAIKGRGRLRISRELEARGVSKAIAREAMDQLPADGDRQAIERLLHRRRIERPLPFDQRRKLFGQLLRRGFPADAIRAVLSYDPADDE